MKCINACIAFEVCMCCTLSHSARSLRLGVCISLGQMCLLGKCDIEGG